MEQNANALPKVTLGQYKGLEFTRRVRPVSEKAVELEAENLTRTHAPFAPVEKSAARGMRVTLDFEGFMDGAPIPESKMENVTVVLGTGQLIRQGLVVGGKGMRLHGGDMPQRPALAHPGKADGKAEQFIKDHAAAAGFDRRPIARGVDGVEGFRVAHQAVLLRQTAARQRIGELLHLVEGFGDLAADHLIAEALGERIDRQQGAGFLRAEYLRGVHLPGVKAAGKGTVKEVFLSLAQRIDGVFGIEKGDVEGDGAIHGGEAKNGKPPADALLPALGGQQRPDGALLPRNGFRQRGGMGEIDIAAGDVVEEVLHGIHAELMVKLGAALPYPFEVADIALQFQRHRAASFPGSTWV